MKRYQKHIIFGIILIAGILFRLMNLDKSEGLWYDEATIYSIASQSGLSGMLKADSHRFLLFPLYYIVYNLWINIFGNTDIIIRLMSVFFDILGIISAYFVGSQFGKNINLNSDKTGLIYMLLYAINSSFIYYAQEAKFYSLTFFIINIILLYWLKYIYDKTNCINSKKNLYTLTALNFLLILTYSSQILLVILIFAATCVYLLRKKLLDYKEIFIYSLSFIIPLCASLFFKNYISGNFDAVVYDNSFILLALQNWFSPILNGLQNNILNYHIYLLSHILSIQIWLFIIFPVSLGLYGIIKCIKNDKSKIALYLFFIAASYIALHILFTYTTGYNVLIRYTLPALPILLLTCAGGISQFKNQFVLYLFIIINIIGIISLSGAPNIKRPDGYKSLADTLIKSAISQDYSYVMPIRPNLLDKYFFIKGKRYSIYLLNSIEAQKTYLTPNEISEIKSNKNKNKFIKRYLIQENIPKEFENYIINNFAKENKNLVIIKDNSIAMLSNEQLKLVAKSNNYEAYPFQFLRLSKLYNDTINVLKKNYKLKQKITNKNWEIYIFEIQ